MSWLNVCKLDIIQNLSISVKIDDGFTDVEFNGSNTPAEIQMQVENGTIDKRKKNLTEGKVTVDQGKYIV